MSIVHYFNRGFQSDIAKLQFREVPQVLKDILNDQSLVLFGGKNWPTVQDDLENIDPDNRSMFVLCLFALVATDQCMQTYFKQHYPDWRAQTQYPKFAWTRFGLYNENPLKLLSLPERSGMLDTAKTCDLMREFAVFYRGLVTDYCHVHAPQLSPDLFFTRLLQDDIFGLDGGDVVAAFMRASGALVPEASDEGPHSQDYFLPA
jgi:hypothetical protein